MATILTRFFVLFCSTQFGGFWRFQGMGSNTKLFLEYRKIIENMRQVVFGLGQSIVFLFARYFFNLFVYYFFARYKQ